jgi:hypothetical protein
MTERIGGVSVKERIREAVADAAVFLVKASIIVLGLNFVLRATVGDYLAVRERAALGEQAAVYLARAVEAGVLPKLPAAPAQPASAKPASAPAPSPETKP